MAIQRPGLTSPTGHADIINASTITSADVLTIVQGEAVNIKEDVIAEVALPIQTSVVTSFNGLTGAVEGVSSFNGATGPVSFTVDGGEY